MGREKYVGRVGALAVALGIGSAIVGLAGVAWADPEGSASAGASQDAAAKSDHRSAATDRPSVAESSKDAAESSETQEPSAGKRGPGSTKRDRADEDADESRDGSEAQRQKTDADVKESAPSKTPPATESKPLTSPRTTALPEEEPADVDADAASVTIPANSYQSPVIGSDGTVYQVTSELGGPSRVTVLDSDGQVIATSRDIRGNTNQVDRAVARPDGTLIVTTYQGLTGRTVISSVNSQGGVRTIATVRGFLDEPVTVGADGALYFSTSTFLPIGPIPPAVGLRSYRVSPSNFLRSFAHDTEVNLASDGSAALVSSLYGFSSLRTFGADGATRWVPLPFGSDPSGPILDGDGNVYVTAGVTPFGAKQTRLYTVAGPTSTVRTVTGLPGVTVVADDGVYLETFTYPGSTDDGTGTTYVSRITATTLDTSDVIDGRIAGLQVGADGTVYAPIDGDGPDTTPVAVVDRDGTVTTVTLPGALVVGGRNVRGGRSQGSDGFGYVNYTAGGTEHVAVLNPDGSVARTIDLPPGASGGSVFFGPDGTAYQLLIYTDGEGQPESRQILALSTSTYTAVVTGRSYYRNSGVSDVVFGPNGVGYLLTGTLSGEPGNSENLDVLGFSAAGDTVLRVSGLLSPVVQTNTFDGTQGRCLGRCGSDVLAFDADGTAHVVVYNSQASDTGVFALTASGAVEVADLTHESRFQGYLPVFAADGTGYVSTGTIFTDFQPSTKVVVFSTAEAETA